MDGAERCEQEKQLKTPSLSPYCFPALRLRAGTPSCEPLETANPKLVTADNSRDREKLIVFNDTLHLWYAFLLSLLLLVGLAQSVERLTAEREVAGSIPGAGPILRVLK